MNALAMIEVYRQIASGEVKRGDFLTAFAAALMRADFENKRLLMPVASVLGLKYKLWEGAELKTPGPVIITEDAETLHEVLKTWDALSQYDAAPGQEGAYQYGSDHRHDLRDRLRTLAQKLAVIANPPNAKVSSGD